MSNWNSTSISKAAESVREAMQGHLRSQYLLTKSLKKLKSALDDGEFVRFLMDCEVGLGVAQSTAYKFERMVSSLDVIPTEKVWEKIGWSGVSKVSKVSTRDERVAVCRTVVREPGVVSKHRLEEIMADKAPSYSARKGRRGPRGTMTKTRAIRERDVLADTLTRLLKDYAVLRREVPDEVKALLGINGEAEPEAQAG